MESCKFSATTQQFEVTGSSDTIVGAPILNQLGKLGGRETPLADDRGGTIRVLLQQTSEEYGVTRCTHRDQLLFHVLVFTI